MYLSFFLFYISSKWFVILVLDKIKEMEDSLKELVVKPVNRVSINTRLWSINNAANNKRNDTTFESGIRNIVADKTIFVLL